MGKLFLPMALNPQTELYEERIFNRNLQNTYHVPCGLLGAVVRRVNKTKISVAMDLYSCEKHKQAKNPRKMCRILKQSA